MALRLRGWQLTATLLNQNVHLPFIWLDAGRFFCFLSCKSLHSASTVRKGTFPTFLPAMVFKFFCQFISKNWWSHCSFNSCFQENTVRTLFMFLGHLILFFLRTGLSNTLLNFLTLLLNLEELFKYYEDHQSPPISVFH